MVVEGSLQGDVVVAGGEGGEGEEEEASEVEVEVSCHLAHGLVDSSL